MTCLLPSLIDIEPWLFCSKHPHNVNGAGSIFVPSVTTQLDPWSLRGYMVLNNPQSWITYFRCYFHLERVVVLIESPSNNKDHNYILYQGCTWCCHMPDWFTQSDLEADCTHPWKRKNQTQASPMLFLHLMIYYWIYHERERKRERERESITLKKNKVINDKKCSIAVYMRSMSIKDACITESLRQFKKTVFIQTTRVVSWNETSSSVRHR